MGTSCPVFSSCSRDKMNGGHLLIVTFLGFLALTDGGHLFGKGFVKGALKTLFKSEKKEQNCEIKWEDVWKPHCTTTYEKICKQEPQKECSTEWREECWTEHEEKCETEWSSECQTEYRQQCRTEWVEECWKEDEGICEWLQDCHEPHHEPEEHHYSPKLATKCPTRGVGLNPRSCARSTLRRSAGRLSTSPAGTNPGNTALRRRSRWPRSGVKSL